ncbi:MAG: hypothetical protein HOE53_04240 [Candidatus Magasanikbacteria bacterium]|nr:hypothetical protein [Candidatus Magasanikbacteria bacterium]
MFHDQCAAGELPVLGLISFAITVHDTPEVHNDGLFVNIRLGVDSMLAAIAMGKIPEHNGGYLALGYAYDVVYMVRQAGLNWLNLNEGVLMTQVPDPTGETYITVMRNGFTGAVEMFLVVDSITGEAIAVSYGPDSVNDRNLHNRGRSRQRCAEMI